MPENDGHAGKHFHPEVPVRNEPFFLKGSAAYDWGMQNRLARVFNRKSGRTAMLAIDHGYFQGPTTGLERIDLTITPLLSDVDALFCTRGILRSSIPPAVPVPVFLRASGGPSILNELSDEQIAMDIEDAVRLNACGVGVQVFIGSSNETTTVHNMTRLVDAGLRSGIPVMGVTAVGRELTRDSRYLGLASRIVAELGAQIVKTYYCEPGFEEVTAGCPVPVVMAGGKKLAEAEALTMAYRAVQEGAAGVDMGRNIFQSESPSGMLAAIRGVVHHGLSPDQAVELYQTVRADGREPADAIR